jgi:hypothetical protein
VIRAVHSNMPMNRFMAALHLPVSAAHNAPSMSPPPRENWFVRLHHWSERYGMLYWSGGDAEMKRLLGDDAKYEPLRRVIRSGVYLAPEYMIRVYPLLVAWIGAIVIFGRFIEAAWGKDSPQTFAAFLAFLLLTGMICSKLALMAARYAGPRLTWRVLAANGIPICIVCGYDFRESGETICPRCGAAYELRRRG